MQNGRISHRSAFVKGDRHMASTVTERRQAIGSSFGSDNPLTAPTNGKFPRVKFLLAGRNTCCICICHPFLLPLIFAHMTHVYMRNLHRL